MSGFPLSDLQQALYELLSEDATLVAAGWKTYDYVPDNTDVKIVVIGDDTTTDNDTKTAFGMAIETQIHTWSRTRGNKDMKVAMDRIYDLLHEQKLELENFQVVVCRQTYSSITRDPDGITRHGIQRFTIITR